MLLSGLGDQSIWLMINFIESTAQCVIYDEETLVSASTIQLGLKSFMLHNQKIRT